MFLVEGTDDEPANRLGDALVAVRRIGGASERAPAEPALLTPAGEGQAEAPASAPMDIPPAGGHRTSGGSTQEGHGR